MNGSPHLRGADEIAPADASDLGWLSADAPVAVATAALAPAATASRPAPAAGPTPDSDVVAWAAATGRIPAGQEMAWRGRLARDPAGTTSTLKAMVADPDVILARAGISASAPSRPISASRPAAVATGPYTGEGRTLPAFTASGIDPSVLLQYPAPVRPAIAAAATPSEAYALANSYAGMSDDQAATAMATDMRIPDQYAHSWATATDYVDPVRARDAEMRAASQATFARDAQHRQRVAAADQERRRREDPEAYGFWDAMNNRQSRRG